MEKEIHETQPASPTPLKPEIAPAFPTPLHPLPLYKSKWLLILTISFLTIFVSAYSIQFFAERDQKEKQKLPIQLSQTSAPTQITLPSEVQTFPIYPDAKFVKKQYTPPCEIETPEPICDTTAFTWETPIDGDTVLSWYKNDVSKSGWICGKEGGGTYAGPRDIIASATCNYNEKDYGFYLFANESKTEFTLRILGER